MGSVNDAVWSPGEDPMIFGDTHDFAIEVDSDATHESPAGTVWGHMRIWCRDEFFGDSSNRHCGLSGAHQALMEMAARLPELKLPEFMDLDDLGVWRLLDQSLYGDDARTAAEVNRDATKFSRFNFLTNWGESFDDYKGFVFCRGDREVRFLVQGPASGSVRGVCVTAAGFKKAVSAFDAWCVGRRTCR